MPRRKNRKMVIAEFWRMIRIEDLLLWAIYRLAAAAAVAYAIRAKDRSRGVIGTVLLFCLKRKLYVTGEKESA